MTESSSNYFDQYVCILEDNKQDIEFWVYNIDSLNRSLEDFKVCVQVHRKLTAYRLLRNQP